MSDSLPIAKILSGTELSLLPIESAARSAARSVGSGLGRQILRGVLGSMFGGRK